MKGSVLFNDALNTFYLRLYGVGKQKKKEEEERWQEGRGG